MKKVILGIIIAVVAIIAIISIVSVIVFFVTTQKLGEPKVIEEDNITLTVLSSEDYKFEGNDLVLGAGDYTRVKIKIDNNSNSTYTWSGLNFYLEDEPIAFGGFPDMLADSIEAKTSATGYVYFKKGKNGRLTYLTVKSKTDGDSITRNKYYFRTN